MIINWVAAKAQLFLPVQDAGLDELSINFDFALSAEIMGFLHTKNAVSQQAEADNTAVITRFILDEHELALA
jgi:glycerol-3-phosphate responsive antiterminator